MIESMLIVANESDYRYIDLSRGVKV